MEGILSEQLELPAQAPVMFLPGVVLLPNTLVPLFIFEPRYRALLAHALERERMFVMALLRPGVGEARTRTDFYETAGIGLVRACVGHEDGTSHLVLQGVSRVRLGEIMQERPFKLAQVRELPTVPGAAVALDSLAEKVRSLASELAPEDEGVREKLDDQISQIEDPGVLADVVAHAFLRSPYRQQEVLETLEVRPRLEAVLRLLKEEATG